MTVATLPPKDNLLFFEISAEYGTAFAGRAWCKVLGKDALLLGVYDNDQKLVGGLVLYKTKMKMVSALITPPLAPHCALFYRQPITQSKAKLNSWNKEISETIANFLSTAHARFIKMELPYTHPDVQPFIWKGFEVTPRFTYRLNLEPTSEQLFTNIETGTRSLIRKAEKENLQATTTVETAAIVHMVSSTLRRKKTSISIAHAGHVISTFNGTSQAISTAVLKADQLIGAYFCLCDNTTAYYLLSGYDTTQKNNAIGVFGLWHCILEAKKRGLKYFDFEGSMIPEIEQFFRKFGGELVPYYSIMGGNALAIKAYKMLR